MYSAVSSLPPHDHASITAPPDLGKRPWETNKTGYLNWAREQLVARAQEEEAGAAPSGSAVVGALTAGAYEIARVEDVKAALSVGTGGRRQEDEPMDMR